MKPINEEWQMKIFDLLEGNLTEAESKSLIIEIEKDAALKQEYVLMKRTYLTPDNIEFAHKQTLYKRSGMFVIRPAIYRAAAAAAIILVGSLAFYFYGQKNQILKTSSGISKNQVNPSGKAISDQAITADTVNLSPKNIQTIGKKSVRPTRLRKSYMLIIDSSDLQLQEKDIPYYESPYYVNVPNFQFEENTIDNEVVDTAEKVVLSPENLLPVPREKRRTLMYKLLNNSKTMIANLQLPDISFKALKNDNKPYPKIQMEIKTLKTDVIATLID